MYDKYDRIAENEMLNDMIEKEMHNYRSQALKRLSSIAAHSESNDIALVLAYGWFDSLPSAIKIADRLDLGKLEFLAIQEEFDAFKQEYLSNQEMAQNF